MIAILLTGSKALHSAVKDKAPLPMPVKSHSALYLYPSVKGLRSEIQRSIAFTLATQADKMSARGRWGDGGVLPPPGLQKENLSLYPVVPSSP